MSNKITLDVDKKKLQEIADIHRDISLASLDGDDRQKADLVAKVLQELTDNDIPVVIFAQHPFSDELPYEPVVQYNNLMNLLEGKVNSGEHTEEEVFRMSMIFTGLFYFAFKTYMSYITPVDLVKTLNMVRDSPYNLSFGKELDKQLDSYESE